MCAYSLATLQRAFIGLDTHYPCADGQIRPRHYLDSAASTLMLQPAQRCGQDFLRHYANSHSQCHHGARIASQSLAWARQTVSQFFHAPTKEYACLFLGNGATAGCNLIAQLWSQQRPERDSVLISLMEHHSNDLPHRQHHVHVQHLITEQRHPVAGAIDLNTLEHYLQQHGSRINYIAITAASNVTGIINPLKEIITLAHAHDVRVLVDGAQYAAHAAINLAELDVDAWVCSGHKLYAPGAPGVLLVKRELLEPSAPPQLGGGMVDNVYLDTYQTATALEQRFEAGTPNLVGAVTLAASLSCLQQVGMSQIQQHEQQLLQQLSQGLAAIPGVKVYGLSDHCQRLASVAFNITGLPHGLSAAILNDYFNIAVRNHCFCAHPYVREMLKMDLWDLDIDPDTEQGEQQIEQYQGMVRASLGLYSQAKDVDALLAAVTHISQEPTRYQAHYQVTASGDFCHRHFHPATESLFDPQDALMATDA